MPMNKLQGSDKKRVAIAAGVLTALILPTTSIYLASSRSNPDSNVLDDIASPMYNLFLTLAFSPEGFRYAIEPLWRIYLYITKSSYTELSGGEAPAPRAGYDDGGPVAEEENTWADVAWYTLEWVATMWFSVAAAKLYADMIKVDAIAEEALLGKGWYGYYLAGFTPMNIVGVKDLLVDKVIANIKMLMRHLIWPETQQDSLNANAVREALRSQRLAYKHRQLKTVTHAEGGAEAHQPLQAVNHLDRGAYTQYGSSLVTFPILFMFASVGFMSYFRDSNFWGEDVDGLEAFWQDSAFLSAMVASLGLTAVMVQTMVTSLDNWVDSKVQPWIARLNQKDSGKLNQVGQVIFKWLISALIVYGARYTVIPTLNLNAIYFTNLFSSSVNEFIDAPTYAGTMFFNAFGAFSLYCQYLMKAYDYFGADESAKAYNEYQHYTKDGSGRDVESVVTKVDHLLELSDEELLGIVANAGDLRLSRPEGSAPIQVAHDDISTRYKLLLVGLVNAAVPLLNGLFNKVLPDGLAPAYRAFATPAIVITLLAAAVQWKQVSQFTSGGGAEVAAVPQPKSAKLKGLMNVVLSAVAFGVSAGSVWFMYYTSIDPSYDRTMVPVSDDFEVAVGYDDKAAAVELAMEFAQYIGTFFASVIAVNTLIPYRQTQRVVDLEVSPEIIPAAPVPGAAPGSGGTFA